MPPKKNDGNKDEKNKQVPSPSASSNGGGLGNQPPQHAPQWFISEMEKGIQMIESMIAGRLNMLSETMEKIARDSEVIGHRVKSIEGKQCEFDDSLAALQRELDDYKKTTDGELSDLRGQLDDQENRARRKNLRLAGFPEGVEGRDAVAFVQEWLPKMLDLDGETFEVERAHRSLLQRPANGARPRTIVIWLLHKQKFSTIRQLDHNDIQRYVNCHCH